MKIHFLGFNDVRADEVRLAHCEGSTDLHGKL